MVDGDIDGDMVVIDRYVHTCSKGEIKQIKFQIWKMYFKTNVSLMMGSCIMWHIILYYLYFIHSIGQNNTAYKIVKMNQQY